MKNNTLNGLSDKDRTKDDVYEAALRMRGTFKWLVKSLWGPLAQGIRLNIA